jgi:YD repeat-containing protein
MIYQLRFSYNFSHSYDRYGNPTCASSPGTGCPALGYATGSNQVSSRGWSYDAAGNLLADGTGTGTHTYQWDWHGAPRTRGLDSPLCSLPAIEKK